MLQYVVIPESDHPPASVLQIRGSAAIRGLSSKVLPSVKLDDEMTLHAREIREVRANRMLSSESVPGQVSVANLKPQATLRVGHGLRSARSQVRIRRGCAGRRRYAI